MPSGESGRWSRAHLPGHDPAQRVAAGLSGTDLIRGRLHATIRESHPAWTEEAIAEAVSERMLGARI